MLHHWLKPSSLSFEGTAQKLWANILYYNDDINDFTTTKIAIIGLDESADVVRKILYEYADLMGNDKAIIDLGNIRKKTPDFIIPLIAELLNIGLIPILIGADSAFIYSQYQAYQALKQKINVIFIDECIRFSQNNSPDAYINSILQGDFKDKLLHLSILGAQSHFVHPDVTDLFENKHFDIVRLGYIKQNIEEVEPIIRDGDMAIFHLSALKQSEAPSQKNASPSGFFTEEICRLSRYAGMSDKLSSVGFYGYELDLDHQSAQSLAQMIWYFLDGVLNRKNDFPVATDGLVEYIVDYKNHQYQLVFWRSTKSGRWWMQIPIKNDKNELKHSLVPCSYNDYLAACQGELPERLLNAIQRFA